MAGHKNIISETCLKEEEKIELENNIDFSDKISCGEEHEESDISNSSYCNNLKRYRINDLLSLRKTQLSTHYPQCALRPELQALSIWTCRLRCELQYLGLWKIPNTANSYGNCNCNGTCQTHACEVQSYIFQNSQLNTGGYSQICYGNVPQSQQAPPLQTSPSPTVGSKKAVRSRERFQNYQRSINTELIRITSPTGGGENSIPHHISQQAKPPFIDHRSISSSHLMPAFAKRRMGHGNALHGQLDSSSQYSSNGGHNTEHLCNDDAARENLTHNETSIKSRKESVKAAHSQSDYHSYKASANSRMDKSDQLAENQYVWMNLVKKFNSDYSSPNNKLNNAGNVNKKLIYERRIGSGRLVPREGNWDMRTGNNKQIETEMSNIINNNVEKDTDPSTGELDRISNRNSSIGRYSDPRPQERRILDRRISSSEDQNNSGNGNTHKRYAATSLGEERFDSNYHQQSTHFTGQRSMSFRRREYVDHKDHYRDYRDLRDPKDSRDVRERRDHRGDKHHNYQNHRDQKEEPEWFSEGPTSQHDTIELRGFEEIDDSQQGLASSGQFSKIERKSSENSLLSHNSNNNVNLSTKDNFDISRDVSNNSNNTANTHHKDIDNGSSCNKEAISPNQELTDDRELKTDVQRIVPKTKDFENPDKQRSNVAELFFDNFLDIETLENTLIGSGNDQSISNNNESQGTSRFSRWFFNNANHNVNSNAEPSNNPPIKEDSKQTTMNKDINESDFNSFMSFLKFNNFPTPELTKALPSNVSAVSVEELEARMRKMDTSEMEKTKSSGGDQNLHTNDGNQLKRTECETESDTSPQSPEINTQDVESFRKLLDQLGKPRVDISMNIILPNTSAQPQSLTNHVGAYPVGLSPIPPSNALPHSNGAKQEYMMKLMLQQQQQQIVHNEQNFSKLVPPPHMHHPHHKIPQMSPQQQNENIHLMSIPHHSHHIPMMVGHSQKRLDVQNLIQSVVREELSRSFLEKELKNPNIHPYTKEVISTVLKETFYNISLAGSQNDSIETAANTNVSTASNNLIQSLARGEVSLNLVDHELNKLNNINMTNETSAIVAFKERSRCGTPLTPSLNVSVPTNGNVCVPLPSQVVPAQKQNSILSSECASSDQQKHQTIPPICRPHLHDDSAPHMPTQRELQMHTQAIMQNALYKKKLEIEHEAMRRRQEIHKQHEFEAASLIQQHQQPVALNSNSAMPQQGHQSSSRHVNSPTPLAFTPTSVLRKMTAEKETIATTIASSSPQQIQPHIQQSHLKIPTHSQMSYQHSNQPRMILGGGNFQYMHQPQHQIVPAINGSPQISPQQKSQIRNQLPGSLKWSLSHTSVESSHSVVNNMNNKPLGRPILKGPGPIQPLVPQTTHNSIGQNQSSMNQNSQSIQTVTQMQKYPSIQPPRQIVGQQFSNHLMQHQIPASPQNNMHQQLFQQQRSVVMQRQQIQQNELGNHLPLAPPAAHHSICNDSNSVTSLNFQRDGGLSPTSNQLAQWFSPELLAQASAGKLPLLNMNQALSLEEFERRIQHSSTAVNN